MVETNAGNHRDIIEPMRTQHTIVAVAYEKVVVIVMKPIVCIMKFVIRPQIVRELAEIEGDILVAVSKSCHQASLALPLYLRKVVGSTLRILVSIKEIIGIQAEYLHVHAGERFFEITFVSLERSDICRTV